MKVEEHNGRKTDDKILQCEVYVKFVANATLRGGLTLTLAVPSSIVTDNEALYDYVCECLEQDPVDLATDIDWEEIDDICEVSVRDVEVDWIETEGQDNS